MPKDQQKIEDWVRTIVEKELQMNVVVHDDGTEDGMYDLRIGSKDAPDYAIECVGAVDEIAVETWNVGPAKGSIDIDTDGIWDVMIKRSTNIKQLKKSISTVIKRCQEIELYSCRVDDWQLTRIDKAFVNELNRLGIVEIYRYAQNTSGKVDLSMEGGGSVVSEEGGGSVVSEDGDALVDWIGEFLGDAKQKDVVKKLRNSCAREKHVFIPALLGGVPWNVASCFLGTMPILKRHPKLPEPINGVWMILDQKGIRYINGKWHVFTTYN